MTKSSLLAAVALLAANPSAAATSIIECPPDRTGYMQVSPSPADSTQSIRIVAGKPYYDPVSATIVVHDNTIDVTLNAESIDFLPPQAACTSSLIGPLPSGVYTVNLTLNPLTLPNNGPMQLASTTLEVSGPPAALSGLWWNASEPGWGINFTQRGNVVFAVWYTYDSNGTPKWYAAPRCEMPKAGEAGRCTESIYEVNGPIFFKSAFDPTVKHVDAVGSLVLEFANSNAASMVSSINGVQRTSQITRQPLRSGTTPPAINYTDLWWNPDESGWGIGVAHEFDVMFLTWFVYDDAGKPMWYVASNCDYNASTERCSGALYRTTGPGMGKTFDSTKVHAFSAGTVSLQFLDSNNAVLEYTVDGVTSTKSVKRQIF